MVLPGAWAWAITETKALAGGCFANLLYACRCLKAGAISYRTAQRWR
jgi:hypothetical protein